MNYRIFGSSEDPQKLGDTVKGLILSLSVVIIAVAGHFGFTLGQPEIVNLATALGGAVASVWTIYGLLKKVLVKTAVR